MSPKFNEIKIPDPTSKQVKEIIASFSSKTAKGNCHHTYIMHHCIEQNTFLTITVMNKYLTIKIQNLYPTPCFF